MTFTYSDAMYLHMKFLTAQATQQRIVIRSGRLQFYSASPLIPQVCERHGAHGEAADSIPLIQLGDAELLQRVPLDSF